jgi:hypothetical protein
MKFMPIRVLIAGFLLICSLCYAGPLPIVDLDRVVAIGRRDTTLGSNFGKWTGEASGFFYGEFKGKTGEQSAYQLYLVTNRHVIEEHIAATNGPLLIRLNPMSGGAVQEYDFPLVLNGIPTWHADPDPTVDLAVVVVNGPLLQQIRIKFDYFHGDFDALSRAKAKELGLSEGYGVFVLGFPMNLVGTGRDYVIVREGSIARIRDLLDSPATVKSFMIDSLVFPGGSGSPVVLKPESILSQFPGEKPPINSAYLLGIVRGHIPYTDVAVSAQTRRPRVTFEENSGLAEVISADYIEETIQDMERTSAATASPMPTSSAPNKP